jgi:opacity protein-like surface antigen
MRPAKVVLAVLLAVGAMPAVNAKIIDVEKTGGTTTLNGSVEEGIKNITDVFKFSLSKTSNLSANFDAYFLGTTATISSFAWTLEKYDTSTKKWTSLGSSPTFSNLTSGKYRFDFDGSTKGKIFDGGYAGSYTVAAVPELDTWLMLLIGVGLVIYQLRRKQKTLRHGLTT